MDIRGTWKIKELHVLTEDGELIFTPDNPPTDEDYEGYAKMLPCLTEFADDGVMNTLMPVPEELKEEAEAEGIVIRDDGYGIIESTVWKEENGRFWYDTKIEGEALGEAVDPYEEIKVTEDGCLRYGLDVFVLERV